MKIKLDKKTTLKMIEKYYKDQMDIEGKATAIPEKDWEGYGMGEQEVCVVKVKITGTMKMLGETIETEIEVSEEEIKNAVQYCIEQEGYTFESYRMEKGLTEECEGYGLGERRVEKPYFKGIIVTVKENTKKIGGK